MRKQKICIVGDGLTGLTTALILSKLDIDIDLIFKKNTKYQLPDTRVTAISEYNFHFLSENFNENEKKLFWPCTDINLFYERANKLSLFMNFENQKRNLMYIAFNKNIKRIIYKKIKKKNNINIKNAEIDKVNINSTSVLIKNKNFFYDLVILCLGRKSKLVPQLIGNRVIEESTKETAFTSLVQHQLNISNPKQYFLKEGPLAILPLNSKNFSLVWSLRNQDNIKKIKNLTHYKLKQIFNTKTKITLKKSQLFPISFKFNTNFFKKNFLILGEGIYNIHPIAGQGFNLIMRDIRELYEELKRSHSLGLQIKDSSILKRFSLSRKPENLLFGLGVNFTNSFFKQRKATDHIKEIILKDINKFKFLKDLSLKISNKGIFK